MGKKREFRECKRSIEGTRKKDRGRSEETRKNRHGRRKRFEEGNCQEYSMKYIYSTSQISKLSLTLHTFSITSSVAGLFLTLKSLFLIGLITLRLI